MSANKAISLKMTEAEIEALDSLVALRFESRSAAIRAALNAYYLTIPIKRSAEIFMTEDRRKHPERRRKSMK